MSGATPLVDDVPDIPEPKSPSEGCAVKVYSIYVLFMLLVTHLINQLDRFLLGIVTKPMSQELRYGDLACMRNESVKAEAVICNATSQYDCESAVDTNSTHQVCKWDHNGQGLQFELLAGPAFIVVYTLSGIPISILADLSNRRNLLVAGLALWSAMTLVTGFVQTYWQLVVTRFLVGIGEAACTPLASSMIADCFVTEQRALALGFYNWGIYIGYSMSYAVGNFVTGSLGWRWAWIISGIPGIVLSAVILLTVREPVRSTEGSPGMELNHRDVTQPDVNWRHKVGVICRTFFQPSLLMLSLAGSIRNAAGYVWAYNAQIYYQDIGTDDHTIAWYMSWIPLVFGCIGVTLGGFISDRIVKRLGPYARLSVLIASQAVAVPFVAGALYFNPPMAFTSLIPAYVIGEMWVSVTLAVAIEVVPVHLRTSAIAVYLFIISNVGGNVPLLVPLLKTSFQGLGYDSVSSLRAALYVLFPGLYLLGSLLFVAAMLMLRWDLSRQQQYQPLRPHSN